MARLGAALSWLAAGDSGPPLGGLPLLSPTVQPHAPHVGGGRPLPRGLGGSYNPYGSEGPPLSCPLLPPPGLGPAPGPGSWPLLLALLLAPAPGSWPWPSPLALVLRSNAMSPAPPPHKTLLDSIFIQVWVSSHGWS